LVHNAQLPFVLSPQKRPKLHIYKVLTLLPVNL
jgi:hypothetical protein